MTLQTAAANIPEKVEQRTLFIPERSPAPNGEGLPHPNQPAPDTSLYGSFRDSLKAPIHRWFTYPAGYSYKLIEAKINEHKLTRKSWIADPFVGTGTTSVSSKMLGVNSLGVEAHPFVFEVATTKMYFDYNVSDLSDDIGNTISAAQAYYDKGINCENIWPDLIYKCFTVQNQKQLFALRQAITNSKMVIEHANFLKLALTATLRIVTTAGAGWPYIAPSKYAARTVKRNAFEEFSKRCNLMLEDIMQVQSSSQHHSSQHVLIKGDARKFSEYAEENTIDLILTSPPYLNNYDYADRTRLETYFWGLYNSWGEITREVRNNLITAATTQITRNSMSESLKCASIATVSSDVYADLCEIIQRLSHLRSQKGGKKSYDLLVAGYFEDMLKTIKGAYKLLRKGGSFVLVLGDSAPYGVHVSTDEIVGRLAVAIGFSRYDIKVLRTRGGKWGHNPQRHNVPLRESILTITK